MADGSAFVGISLSAGSLDDIPEIPSFKVLPTGGYEITLNEGIMEKVINKDTDKEKTIAEMAMTVDAVHETSDLNEGENAPLVGDICTLGFMLDNEFGAANLGTVLKAVGQKFGITSIPEIVGVTRGLKLLVVLKRVQDKKDKSIYRNRLVNVAVL